MTKRILSILTAVMLFCSMAMPIASAEEEYQSDIRTFGDFTYQLTYDPWVGDHADIIAYNGNEKHVVLPDEIEGLNVSWLCARAFADNQTVETVELSKGLSSIHDAAFQNCTNLKEVNIPDSVGGIGRYAFKGCTSLASIELSDKITYLHRQTFKDCTSLESVELSDNLQFVGGNAFRNCISLKEITLPKKLKGISGYAFSNTPNLEIKVHKENTSFKMKNGVLLTKDGKRLIAYTKDADKCYVVPKSVKIIYKGAFMDSAIEQVTLQSGVEVRANAFKSCHKLKEVRINKGVKAIKSAAFYNCTRLKKVVVKPKKIKLKYAKIGVICNPKYSTGADVNRKVKIYGYKGSTAQAFVKNQNKTRAKANRFKFIAL